MGESGSRVPVEVRVLGKFEVSVGGRSVELSSGRLRALLAVLAMSAGRSVSADRLIDTVWGDDLPEDARRTVQVYVARLRNALGADAIDTEPAGYVLCTSPDKVDALEFVRLADRAGQESTVEHHLLVEALALWRGTPFEGVPSAYLHEVEAPRLDERRLTCLEQRFDLDLSEDRAADVVGEMVDLTAEHPLRESLWARLIVALARAGRPAEALAQYETIRSRIVDELGVDPGAELQQLHADLLAGAIPAAPRRSTETPPDSAPVPRQLPADIGGFSGRTTVLDKLDELLIPQSDTDSGPGVVVVHGIGGVGKTTLAVHWAHRAVGAFPDGQLYLNLRGYGPTEPMTVASALDTLLRGLGVPSDQIPTDAEARTNLLRSMLADRRMLLLLDNAHDADQVRPLLPGAGASCVIVTSRNQLRGLVAREGAQRIAVDLLDPPESIALLATVLEQREVEFGSESLAELASLCGHLPLALAIAAERASVAVETGPAEIVDEIREHQARLDVLELGDESTDVRAVFAWSYQALDVDTARLFRLLGLHPAHDTSLPGASALAGTSPAKVRRLLDRLVDINLLQQRRGGRYELHDLLRVYAAELAQQIDPPADREAALSRYINWHILSASNARNTLGTVRPLSGVRPEDPRITPLRFESRREALAWLEAEYHTLDPLVRATAAHDQHRRTYQLVHAWRNHLLDDRRALYELLELLDLAGDAADRAADDTARAEVSNLRGRTHYELMRYEEAIRYFERAHSLFEEADDRIGMCLVLCNLGMANNALGRLEDAASFYQRSLAVRIDPADDTQRPITLNNLGMTYIDMGRHEEAAETSRRAVVLAHQRDQHRSEASALDTLGQALHALGHVDEAIEHLSRSRDLLVQASCPRWTLGTVLVNLGRAMHAGGRTEEARAAWQEALDILDELDAPDGREFGRTMLIELLAKLPPAEAGANT
jgi:DNA-binding SARP family transcriptional activator/tetratricopeptide (TPR) repeat protein